MFLVREYAACLIVALFLATLLFAGCGIFLALKAGYRIGVKLLQSSRGMKVREAHAARIASLLGLDA